MIDFTSPEGDFNDEILNRIFSRLRLISHTSYDIFAELDIGTVEISREETKASIDIGSLEAIREDVNWVKRRTNFKN